MRLQNRRSDDVRIIKNLTEESLAPIVDRPFDLRRHAFSGRFGYIRESRARWAGQSVEDQTFGQFRFKLLGGGADFSAQQAALKAVIECAERYASAVCAPRDIKLAKGEALHDAIPVEKFPRFSEEEIARSPDLLGQYDAGAEIRWVKGFCCQTRRIVSIPLVMTHFVGHPLEAEQFCLPISTGVAAHTQRDKAILAAILEVIERDVIATTWLARLPLRRLIMDDDIPIDLAETVRQAQRSSSPLTILVSDGEFGVPSFYAIRQFPQRNDITTMVGCATKLDPVEGIRKAISEVFSVELALQNHLLTRSPVASPEDCTNIVDGALYMAAPSRMDAFDFLLQTEQSTRLSALRASMPSFSGLKEFIRALQGAGLSLYLCDITPDDIADAGIHVVRALIPELMPFSCLHRGRYLGTPRLFQKAETVLGRPFALSNVNPMPQPFA
ncbi:YcaO-like family protein [Candidatus Kirkpatrickella diaphorinae]|uniref:YcaO-like family protein n=1 Tax=Candidatus Kirkpatrickella diaphorinae TaxID=2984322 RepID=A0ABY6GHI6_9PROT|nr:YcaO-like family protein [Candidatus Kirkpatrickella diaphorinae]UYH50880.1 YcaO-like family protein [Candidatus Kirkpatrickella diaphorinae]